MGFATALSGLKAASASLQVTGNNIANSQTSGFKESRAEFADVYASSIGGVSKTQPGAGVRVTEVAQQFNQGNIESTQNSLDLAISGNGFFVLADKVNLPDPNNPALPVNPSVPNAYTRNGAFRLDSSGNVVNGEGKYLLAFAPNGTTAAAGFSTGVFRPLTIDTAQGLPNATSNVGMKLNINGAATVPSASVFDPTNPLSYNNTTSITSYDTQGNAHIVSTYYVKTPVANAWNAYVFLDNYGITTGGAAVPPAKAPASTVSSTINAPGLPIPMTFNASGRLDEVGTRAAGVISKGIVTLSNTTVANTTNASTTAAAMPTAYTNAAAAAPTATDITDASTAVADTATASTDATGAAGAGWTAGKATTAATSAATAAASAAAAAASAGVTAAAGAAAIPSVAALATAWSTAATNASTSAAAYAALTPVANGNPAGTAAASAAATAAADAVLAQTALNNYNAAVTAYVATNKQTAVTNAQLASTSATAMAAAAASVNTIPSTAALAATSKTTAATAAASAATAAASAAAIVDALTAATAATDAAQAASDAVIAQTAANAYDTAVSAATSGFPQTTKVDFGNINLGLINPSANVDPMAFDLDFYGSTQFATPFSVNGLNQDGLPAGNLTGIDIDGTGVVFARYSNGGSKPLGQVALARFQSNQSLAKLGDTTWAQTSSSGQPIYGAAGDNNFGGIQSSALEGSNVDLSDQLVKLIIAQQAYQANSQSITTEKTLIQTILNA